MRPKPPICAIGIRNLVTAFYTRVRRDHVLAPLFVRQVGPTDADWAAHIAAEEDFWSSVILAGDPHRARPAARRLCRLDLEPAVFERWLSLLGGTCTDLFEPPVAVALKGYPGGPPAEENGWKLRQPRETATGSSRRPALPSGQLSEAAARPK
jgi:hemoglobin